MHKKQSRILISTFTYPPADNGVANSVYLQAQMILRLGYSVDVLTAGSTYTESKENNVSVIRFPVTGRGRLLSPHKGAISELNSYLSKHSWDIVLMNCWQAWSTNCLIDYFIKHLRKERLYLISHGVSTNSNYHVFPLNLIRRILWWPYKAFAIQKYLRLITGLVVLRDYYDNDRFFDYKKARQLHVPVKIIPNVARFNPNKLKRPSIRFSDKELASGFILSVGNYSHEKNEFFVLKAYKDSRLTDIPFIIVGHKYNGYSAKLMDYANKWKLSNVHFCERLSKEEIDWLYKHATIFLYGSKIDCLPMVILDSLASKTLCISTDVGCVRSLDGVVIVASIEEMALQLRYYYANQVHRNIKTDQAYDLYDREFRFSSVLNKWDQLLTNSNSNMNGPI